MTLRALLPVLALTAALVSACGGDSNPNPMQPTPTPTPAPTPAPTPNPPPAPPSNTRAISISQNAQGQGSQAFGANPLTIPVGTVVTWTNNDTVPHTATSNTAGQFNSGVIDPGQSASATFNTAGSIPYRCTLHPGMTGTIVVQ